MQRIAVQQPGGPDLHDLPGVHHHRAVADGGGQLEVVGDEQHGQAEVAAQAVEYRHHLGLGRDIQGGGRLVGQQQARLGQQGSRDHDPLQDPAGHLVRVLPEPLGPVLDTDLGERVGRAAARLLRRHSQVGAQGLGHEVPDPSHRIDVRPRVLEDHRHLAAVPAQGGSGEAAGIAAAEADRAMDFRPAWQQPADRPRGHGLPRPGLADQAHRLTGPYRERDVAEYGAPGTLHVQQHGQPVHLE